MPFRIDRVPIKKWDKMPNGSLRVLGTIARVGELKYLNTNGTIRTEHLTADELFNEQWLDSIANSPATLGHPPVPVTPTNWKQYAVGAVGGVPIPRKDDGELDFVHIINDEAAINAVVSGRATQLSPGYGVSIREDGHRLFQIDRIGNHSAIVEFARGSSICRLHLDSFRMDGADDDFAVQILSNEAINLDMQGMRREHTDEKHNLGGKAMTAIVIGNRTYNVDGDDAPKLADAIATTLDKNTELEKTASTAQTEATEHKDRADAAEASLSTAKGELKGAQTKLSDATKRADEAEKNRMDGDAIAAAIQTRMDAWSAVLPAIQAEKPDFVPDFKLDEMDIKRLWLLHKDESLKDDENFKNDGFVNGLWRSLKPDPTDNRVDTVDGLAALVNMTRSDAGGYGGGMSDRQVEKLKEEKRKANADRIAANGRSLMGNRN